MAMPVTRYAKSGDVHVAYQVFGSGPIDLVFVPGFVSHIENYWDHPDLARWLLRLGGFARVTMFDKRGTGLSDRSPSFRRWTCVWTMSAPLWMLRDLRVQRCWEYPKAAHWRSCSPQPIPSDAERLVLYGGFARSSSGRGTGAFPQICR